MPEMLTVYRVEQKDAPGSGPFWGCDELGGNDWGKGMWWDGPSAAADCGRWTYGPDGMRVGCFEPKQIDRWFPPDWRMKWADRLDLLVFKVPADEVARGSAQVIFKRPTEPYARLPLDTPTSALPT